VILSIWDRIFRKSPGRQPVSKPLSLTAQYQRKVQRYQEIAAAGNAALKALARMQADLAAEVYFTPAYVQLQSEVALSQAHRAVTVLKEFSRGKEQKLGEIFDSLERDFRAACSQAVATENPTLALPFERHTLPENELLAGGVAYPAQGQEPPDQLIVEAGWGWGAVAGGMEMRPWRYQVSLGDGAAISSAESGAQATWLIRDPQQGLKTEALPADLKGRSCLQAQELKTIAQYVGLLISRFHGPQQVAWVLGPDQEVIVLRSAPGGEPPGPPLSSEPPPVTIPGGVPIYPGLAAGPSLRVAADQAPSPQDIPAGTVLLADKPALSLGPLLGRAAALVVAAGEAHNHLAFLAREARVPTIFNCGEALDRIPPGARIGVDARRLEIFVADPEIPRSTPEPRPGSQPPVARKILRELSPLLFPLQEPPAPGQSPAPERCRSLHDLLFYAAAARVREMFTLSLRAQVTPKDAVSLVTGRLIPILVIDGGGGLAKEGSPVNFEAVSSLPFQTFLGGMMSIPWPKARPLDVKGFISVIGVTATTPQAEDQLRKVSFALLSRDYMNFSLCLGYHASTIEAFVGESLDDHYIRFHYQGGAAALERRVRRLQLIGGILSRLGFTVTLAGDLLDGMAIGDPMPALMKKLEILGRLEVYTKQMDMVMSDDDLMHGYIEDFFEKHVTFGHPTP
jgi:pyruvate,water dikinase